jgi:hypothetical protein
MDLVLELRPPESRHYPSWRDRLTAVARLRQPDRLHALCEEAYVRGARAVLAIVDEPIREALLAFQRWRDAAVWAVVPNMFAFIRDLTDLGMVGAARARFLRLGPADMLRQGAAALGRLRGVLRKDFATGGLLVADMELAGLRALRVTRLFLHPQLTEVGLAGGVRALFTGFAARAERLGLEAGLVTNNPLRAAALLGADLARFAAVVAPCNPSGYKMFPSRTACEALFRTDPARFLAADPTAGGRVALSAALDYVCGLGLRGVVLDAGLVTESFAAPVQPAAADGDGAPG